MSSNYLTAFNINWLFGTFQEKGLNYDVCELIQSHIKSEEHNRLIYFSKSKLINKYKKPNNQLHINSRTYKLIFDNHKVFYDFEIVMLLEMIINNVRIIKKGNLYNLDDYIHNSHNFLYSFSTYCKVDKLVNDIKPYRY